MSLNASISQPLIFLPYLPFEIIREILSCLPVKTLLRFRCVSKSWLYLMSNPKFINTHLLKSSNINNYTRHRLVHLCTPSGQYGYYLNSCSLHSIFYPPSDINNISIHDAELDYPADNGICPVFLLGSCTGLVCVVIENNLIKIWNPSTRESKKLPGMSLSYHRNTVYGFGYDQVNDDYKVVWVSPDDRGLTASKMIIYSLRTNSWGNIKDFPCAQGWFSNGTFVNGALHWPSSSSDTIVSLNLGNETIGQIAAPDCVDSDFGMHFSFLNNIGRHLSVLDGCLCICCVDHIRSDIWVMKEYGVRDSWIKLCTIRHMDYQGHFVQYHHSPLVMFMTGEIMLLRCEQHLVLYDPIYGTFRNSEIPNLSSALTSLKVTVYSESLVSPHMYDNLRRCPPV